MTLTSIATLAGLALLDSTSFGTLVIPVWLLLAPRTPPLRSLLVYAAVVAGFYAVVGVILVLVADAGVTAVQGAIPAEVLAWVAVVIGVGLFALSFGFDPKHRSPQRKSRLQQWRDRLNRSDGSARRLATLGLTAAGLEVATMVPYLAAVALLVNAELPVAGWVTALLAYCVVMLAPMLVLIAARLTLRSRLDPVMHKVDALLTKYADSALSWILGIAGFLLARAGASTILGWGS